VCVGVVGVFILYLFLSLCRPYVVVLCSHGPLLPKLTNDDDSDIHVAPMSEVVVLMIIMNIV